MFTLDGRAVDYVESGAPDGAGAPVLFAPGSFATASAWRPIQGRTPPTRRHAAVSLGGYGRTEERRSDDDFGMEHSVALVVGAAERLCAAAGAQACHLVGHSFGGSVCLAAALSGAVAPLSLTLFEPTPLEVLRLTGADALYDETVDVIDAYYEAVDAGEAEAARRPLDFWAGPGVFASLPEPVRAYCNKTVAANVLDWKSGFGYRAGRQAYLGLETPLLAVLGARSAPTMAAIVKGLVGLAPNARLAEIDGATHFLISTHADECASLMATFLDEVERGAFAP